MVYRDEVLADSPVGYWRLEETSGSTVADETSNGNDGTTNGGVILDVSSFTDELGSAVGIDSVDDYINHGSPSVLNITGDLTLEAWIKVAVDTAGGIMTWANNQTTYPFHAQVNSDGTIQLNRDGTSIDSSSIVDDDKWHHIVITDDRTNDQVTFYIDGVIDKQTSYTPSPSSGDGNFTLARESDGGYDGLLDEPAVYSSVLSQSRVRAHYYWGLSRYAGEVMDDGPVAYWRLEETSGSTIADETTNSHDGTVTGAGLNTTGKVGSAISYDGTDDYSDHTTLGAFGQSPDQTWECWIRTTTSVESTLTGTFNDGSNTGTQLNLNLDSAGNNTAGALRVYFRFEDGAIRGTVDSPTVDWRDGAWHHLVWRVETSVPAIRVWIDGEEQTFTVNDSSAITSFASYQYPLTWGARNNRGTIDQHADVDVDEPALYDTLLSPTRIQAHFDATQSEVEVVVLEAHTVLLKHRPLFEGRFSPHVVELHHRKAVPVQPHIVNLVHLASTLQGDNSEEGQAKALKKALGYGWGVPDPNGSANEKMETPRENWPIDRFHEAERIMRQEGVEEPTAKAMGQAMRRLGEDIQLDVRANLQKAEWHANVHTHSGFVGAEGTPVGPAEALFMVSGGGAIQRRQANDGAVVWSQNGNFWDLAVNQVDKRVYGISQSSDSLNVVDRVESFDFNGNTKWKIDLHQLIDDATQTVPNFTLARDFSALYTLYYDGSQLGVVRIDTSDGAVSVIGKDTSGGDDLAPRATFDTDGDYLYLSDQVFVNNDRGRVSKFSLGNGVIDWEMSPDLGNQFTCPICVTDTLLWLQKRNGEVLLIDKANGGIRSSVDPDGQRGPSGGNLWKDFHNTNSLYILSMDPNNNDSYLYRMYPVGGVLQAEKLKFLEGLDMLRVIRDSEGNFFLGGFLGSTGTSHLVKLAPDLSILWRLDGPDPRNFCTEQGRSVHWG